LKLLDFIICDDIRHEIGNKITLVGIYDDAINVSGVVPEPQKALRLKLGFYIRFQKEKNDPEFDQFELTIRHNEREIGRALGSVSLADPTKNIVLALALDPILVPGPGQLQFSLRFLKETKPVSELNAPYPFKVNFH
jgi:hypothetical protein